MGITGKVAVVTGAAQGIGRGIALRLAQDGARVAVVDLKSTAETVSLIEAAGGVAVGLHADVSSREEVAQALARTRAELGEIAILVNNAGLHANPPTVFEELGVDEWRRMLAVDLDSVFHFCQLVVPGMKAAGWGRIVNMASATVNAMTHPGMSHYIAAKAGVVGLTRAIASEVGPFGITVNAVAPGGVDTPGLEEVAPEGVMEHLASQQAIPEVITPAQIAGVVSFLSSDDCAMVSAQTIFVDGGLIRAG